MNKMKTVELGSRGQLVVPQEFRKDLHLGAREVLVMIEKGNELVIKKQADVLKRLEEPDAVSLLSEKALGKVWNNKEDDIWAKYL